MDLKELTSGVDPATHWYYQTKIIPLRRCFAKLAQCEPAPWMCLDIGAGSGFFSEALLREFPDAINRVILVDTGYSESELAGASSGLVVKQWEIPDSIERSFVILMDVLEHLPDETILLRNIRGRCRGENRFFITVPAFQSIWSYHDVVLGHQRRYTKESLQAVLANTGFRVERIYYIYRLIFPLVWAYRKMHHPPVAHSDMKPVHPFLNGLLRRVNALEIHLDRVNYQFGLTCVAEGKV
jgi:hypothetical protein